jgi:hypothetical protein
MVIQPGGPSIGTSSSGVGSGAVIIPPLSNGNNPKWIYVCIVTTNADRNGISIKIGDSGVVTPTLTNGIGVSGMGGGVIINVAGYTHYRVISSGGTVSFTMTPLAGIVPGG